MLIRFGFRVKLLYLCIAKRREPITSGFSPFFGPKKGYFTSEIEKFTSEIKIFFSESGFFSGYVGARSGFPASYFGVQFIKNIKVFRAKKFDFNISGVRNVPHLACKV